MQTQKLYREYLVAKGIDCAAIIKIPEGIDDTEVEFKNSSGTLCKEHVVFPNMLKWMNQAFDNRCFNHMKRINLKQCS